MTKVIPTKEQINAFLFYTSKIEHSLATKRYCLDGLVELVKEKKLPAAFLAFEILYEIADARAQGFKDEQYLKVVPKPLASETIAVPIVVLNTLLDCWKDFNLSDPTKASLEKSFGFAAPKPKSNPIQHVVEKLDNDRYYARRVLEKRMMAWSEGRKLRFVQAYADVAAEEKVSSDTVKKAWLEHRSFYKKHIRQFELPTKILGNN